MLLIWKRKFMQIYKRNIVFVDVLMDSIMKLFPLTLTAHIRYVASVHYLQVR